MGEYAEHIEALISGCRHYRGLDPRDVLEAIADPQWEKANRTNDWRNGVPSTVADVWDDLPTEARLVAYLKGAAEGYFQ